MKKNALDRPLDGGGSADARLGVCGVTPEHLDCVIVVSLEKSSFFNRKSMENRHFYI